MAWSGNSGGYIDTVINLGPNLAGQTITLRWRFIVRRSGHRHRDGGSTLWPSQGASCQ